MARFKLGLMLALVLSVTTLSAQAAEDKAGFVGAVAGLSVPDADNSSARAMYGFTGGAKLGSEFGVAGYFLTSTKEESANGINYDFKYNLYGVQASYHFEGEAIGAWFGARLGLSKVTTKAGTVEIDGSPFHFGVAGGYDHFLTDNLSLGAEISYLNVAKFNSTVAGVTYESKAFNMINFLGAAKFWF
jgi:opacity protein-like surface antigen